MKAFGLAALLGCVALPASALPNDNPPSEPHDMAAPPTPNGERKIWQSGGVFGMSSQTILFPDSQEAYVLLANDGCFNTQSELEKIALAVHNTEKPVTAAAPAPIS